MTGFAAYVSSSGCADKQMYSDEQVCDQPFSSVTRRIWIVEASWKQAVLFVCVGGSDAVMCSCFCAERKQLVAGEQYNNARLRWFSSECSPAPNAATVLSSMKRNLYDMRLYSEVNSKSNLNA